MSMTTQSVEDLVHEIAMEECCGGDCGFKSMAGKCVANERHAGVRRILDHVTASGYAIEQGWRDIGSAPKDGTKILALCQPTFFETGKDMPFNYVNVVWWTQRTRYRGDSEADTWGWRHTLTNSNAQPTHWKPIGPLPAAPGGSDGR